MRDGARMYLDTGHKEHLCNQYGPVFIELTSALRRLALRRWRAFRSVVPYLLSSQRPFEACV